MLKKQNQRISETTVFGTIFKEIWIPSNLLFVLDRSQSGFLLQFSDFVFLFISTTTQTLSSMPRKTFWFFIDFPFIFIFQKITIGLHSGKCRIWSHWDIRILIFVPFFLSVANRWGCDGRNRQPNATLLPVWQYGEHNKPNWNDWSTWKNQC